ncbi:hypothetical protein FVB32_02570 [Flagellimonas hymeniacidonis]|uniref:Uncharacterized protein n=1 Tax=Flagellimonas hymeniacidonis TaxID=2603628 RepID=A0A5C8V7N6_9FLAO|nr:hypothetical protein [Flagellimonas hymeniacidonis]TXN37189.1 hypothetical protein FVB32_02570 [Flagellimonas hymeniacidonis]
MSKSQYTLSCYFKLNPESFVKVSDQLEISLPCINCQRDHRTIIFENINEKGICTPRKKCEGFPGKLVSREIIKEADGVKVNYLIEFDYHKFTDLKYNAESNFKFGWARVYFTIKCSECQKEKTISTQENVGRPWDEKCECGNIIFQDYETPFKYQATEK